MAAEKGQRPRARSRYPHPASAATSAVMRGNFRRDTNPEVAVRSLLHRAGLRFRKDLRIRLVSGSHSRADIAFPSRQVAVFIDGCFWHGCPDHGTQPRHNAWYWGPKIARNRARDESSTRDLKGQGWLALRFWEHEAPQRVVETILGHLRRG